MKPEMTDARVKKLRAGFEGGDSIDADDTLALLDLAAEALRLREDVEILHSWHYHRTQHENYGCRCDGRCVLDVRAEAATEAIARHALSRATSTTEETKP